MRQALTTLALALAAVLPPALPAQQSPALPTFDVVSIKPNKSGTNMTMSRFMPDGIRVTNAPVVMLIRQAYNLFNSTDGQITCVPDWAKTERFDIEAKVAEADLPAMKDMKPEQRGLMIQSLLKDRFRMEARRETKEMPIYALVAARGGIKLKEAVPGATYASGINAPDGKPLPGKGAGMVRMGLGTLDAQAIPLSTLVSMLTQNAGRIVLDKTGLSAKYDITLRWTPDYPTGAAPPAAGPDAPPPLFTALQEQLGLRLEPQRGPVDIVVVEHLEHPTEN